jgi:general secretion pathway protein C
MASATAPSEPKPGPLGTILVVALVLVLAYQLAYWTWVFVAPARVASAPPAQQAVDLAAIARLFGADAPGGAPSASALKLKGVIAPTPGVEASAIFSKGGGRDIAVYIDAEVEPGLRLVEVHPDHVIVSRAGEHSRIDLEALRSTGVASARGGMPGKAQGFKLNVARTGSNNYALSRKELDDALRDPGQLHHLGQIGVPPRGGVRMESAPPGSLAQKLGLQPGDVIKKVNGQAVASAGDLARLYTQFNTLSLIQAEIQRGQSTLQLSYQIQP